MDHKRLYMQRKRSIATIVRDVLREEDELDDDDEIRRRLSVLDTTLEEDDEEAEEAMNKMEEEVRKRMQLLDDDLKDVDKEEIKAACKDNLHDAGEDVFSEDSSETPDGASKHNTRWRETVSEDNEEYLENSSALDQQQTDLTNTTPLSNTKDSSEGDYDIKKDILQGLNKSDQNANKPFRISPNVHLEKLREENLAKKRNLSKQGGKMPELSETSETESGKASGASAEEGENGGPPSAFPSLSNRVLSSMGLEHKKGDPLPEDQQKLDDEQSDGAEQMSEADVEEKFISLALAFKTDKMTLEKRIELHERSRDIAEQNVDKELEGLNDALKALSPFCNDATSREVYSKIKHHVEVLEQSTVRVSSRAEVHGAVQQELRMSKAIDVMVQHVENLKRMYEREHSELEETRKLVHDNRLGGDDLSKRSYSVVGSGLKLGGRRRSSAAVVVPRRMSMVSTNSSTQSFPSFPTVPDSPTLDPKTRFLTTSSDTSLKNPVASTEKAPLTSTPNHSTLSNGNEKSDISLKGDMQLDTNRNIDQELIFQKGFEEGVRAQVSQEIEQLRQQQQSFSDNIDQLLDQNEMADDDEEEVETLLDKMWRWWPAFEKSGQRVRFAMATLVFFMALFSIIFTLVPVGSVSAAHNKQPLNTPWYSFEEFLQPHISLRYKEGNPPS